MKNFYLPLFCLVTLMIGSCRENKSAADKDEKHVDYVRVENENLTNEEKKSRSLIEIKLSEEIPDFDETYKPLEYGTLEEYYLDWISSYNLGRLAKAEARGQSREEARANMEDFTIKFRQQFGDRNQDTRKGFRVQHTFEYKDLSGKKKGTFMFYFDNELSKILHIEKLNSIQFPK